jgi:Glycosyl hydrolases family 18
VEVVTLPSTVSILLHRGAHMTTPRRMSRRAATAVVAVGVLVSVLLVAVLNAGTGSATTVSPYLEVSDARSAALAYQALGAGLHHVTVGFIVSGRKACTPVWDGAGLVSRRPFARQIASLRAAGIETTLSFGGQQGRELALTCRSQQALAAAYARTAMQYGIKSVDFDLEGSGLDNRAELVSRMGALQLLQRQDRRMRISVTLPVDTSGLPGDALAAVQAAIRADLRIERVNVMAMDFGDSSAPHPQGRMAFYVRSAAQAAHRQLAALGHGLGSWSKLAVTPMIGINDTQSEIFTLGDARALASWAKSTGVGEIRYWAYNRDRACAIPSPQAQDNCSGVPQQSGAFTGAFRG